jgi:hypothetical protein
MTCKCEGREPSTEAIKGGYWITQARLLLGGYKKYHQTSDEHAYLFMANGLRHIEKAIDLAVKETGMYRMQPGEGMAKLYGAAEELKKSDGPIPFLQRRRIMWDIAAGHDILRKLMAEQGYRATTNEDFDKYGAGGGR